MCLPKIWRRVREMMQKRAPVDEPEVQALRPYLQAVVESQPVDIQETVKMQIQLLESYYADVRTRENESFGVALRVAVVGVLFLMVAIAISLFVQVPNSETVAVLTGVSGIVLQAVSGLLFVLHRETAKQLVYFHNRLDQVQRFILANRMCDQIAQGDARDKCRADLIAVVVQPSISQVAEPDVSSEAK